MKLGFSFFLAAAAVILTATAATSPALADLLQWHHADLDARPEGRVRTPLICFSMVLDSAAPYTYDDVVAVVGGTTQREDFDSSVHLYTPKLGTWAEEHNDAASLGGRNSHAAASLLPTFTNIFAIPPVELIVFGGFKRDELGERVVAGDTKIKVMWPKAGEHEHDDLSNARVWVEPDLPVSPKPRARAASWNLYGTYVYLWGGQSDGDQTSDGFLSDTWRFESDSASEVWNWRMMHQGVDAAAFWENWFAENSFSNSEFADWFGHSAAAMGLEGGDLAARHAKTMEHELVKNGGSVEWFGGGDDHHQIYDDTYGSSQQEGGEGADDLFVDFPLLNEHKHNTAQSHGGDKATNSKSKNTKHRRAAPPTSSTHRTAHTRKKASNSRYLVDPLEEAEATHEQRARAASLFSPQNLELGEDGGVPVFYPSAENNPGSPFGHRKPYIPHPVKEKHVIDAHMRQPLRLVGQTEEQQWRIDRHLLCRHLNDNETEEEMRRDAKERFAKEQRQNNNAKNNNNQDTLRWRRRRDGAVQSVNDGVINIVERDLDFYKPHTMRRYGASCAPLLRDTDLVSVAAMCFGGTDSLKEPSEVLLYYEFPFVYNGTTILVPAFFEVNISNPEDGPSPRRDSSVTYDHARGLFIVTGGYDATTGAPITDDADTTYMLAIGVVNTWYKQQQPTTPIYGRSACSSPNGRELFFFGGRNNDGFKFNSSFFVMRWEGLHPILYTPSYTFSLAQAGLGFMPAPRSFYSIAAVGSQIVIVGGRNEKFVDSGLGYVFDFAQGAVASNRSLSVEAASTDGWGWVPLELPWDRGAPGTWGGSSTVIGSAVYFFGGRYDTDDDGASFHASPALTVYEAHASEFHVVAPAMNAARPEGRSFHCSFSFDSKFVVIGLGLDGHEGLGLDSWYGFDVAASEWHAIPYAAGSPDRISARAGASSVQINSTHALVGLGLDPATKSVFGDFYLVALVDSGHRDSGSGGEQHKPAEGEPALSARSTKLLWADRLTLEQDAKSINEYLATFSAGATEADTFTDWVVRERDLRRAYATVSAAGGNRVLVCGGMSTNELAVPPGRGHCYQLELFLDETPKPLAMVGLLTPLSAVVPLSVVGAAAVPMLDSVVSYGGMLASGVSVLGIYRGRFVRIQANATCLSSAAAAAAADSTSNCIRPAPGARGVLKGSSSSSSVDAASVREADTEASSSNVVVEFVPAGFYSTIDGGGVVGCEKGTASGTTGASSAAFCVPCIGTSELDVGSSACAPCNSTNASICVVGDVVRVEDSAVRVEHLKAKIEEGLVAGGEIVPRAFNTNDLTLPVFPVMMVIGFALLLYSFLLVALLLNQRFKNERIAYFIPFTTRTATETECAETVEDEAAAAGGFRSEPNEQESLLYKQLRRIFILNAENGREMPLHSLIFVLCDILQLPISASVLEKAFFRVTHETGLAHLDFEMFLEVFVDLMEASLIPPFVGSKAALFLAERKKVSPGHGSDSEEGGFEDSDDAHDVAEEMENKTGSISSSKNNHNGDASAVTSPTDHYAHQEEIATICCGCHIPQKLRMRKNLLLKLDAFQSRHIPPGDKLGVARVCENKQMGGVLNVTRLIVFVVAVAMLIATWLYANSIERKAIVVENVIESEGFENVAARAQELTITVSVTGPLRPSDSDRSSSRQLWERQQTACINTAAASSSSSTLKAGPVSSADDGEVPLVDQGWAECAAAEISISSGLSIPDIAPRSSSRNSSTNPSYHFSQFDSRAENGTASRSCLWDNVTKTCHVRFKCLNCTIETERVTVDFSVHAQSSAQLISAELRTSTGIRMPRQHWTGRISISSGDMVYNSMQLGVRADDKQLITGFPASNFAFALLPSFFAGLELIHLVVPNDVPFRDQGLHIAPGIATDLSSGLAAAGPVAKGHEVPLVEFSSVFDTPVRVTLTRSDELMLIKRVFIQDAITFCAGAGGALGGVAGLFLALMKQWDKHGAKVVRVLSLLGLKDGDVEEVLEVQKEEKEEREQREREERLRLLEERKGKKLTFKAAAKRIIFEFRLGLRKKPSVLEAQARKEKEQERRKEEDEDSDQTAAEDQEEAKGRSKHPITSYLRILPLVSYGTPVDLALAYQKILLNTRSVDALPESGGTFDFSAAQIPNGQGDLVLELDEAQRIIVEETSREDGTLLQGRRVRVEHVTVAAAAAAANDDESGGDDDHGDAATAGPAERSGVHADNTFPLVLSSRAFRRASSYDVEEPQRQQQQAQSPTKQPSSSSNEPISEEEDEAFVKHALKEVNMEPSRVVRVEDGMMLVEMDDDNDDDNSNNERDYSCAGAKQQQKQFSPQSPSVEDFSTAAVAVAPAAYSPEPAAAAVAMENGAAPAVSAVRVPSASAQEKEERKVSVVVVEERQEKEEKEHNITDSDDEEVVSVE